MLEKGAHVEALLANEASVTRESIPTRPAYGRLSPTLPLGSDMVGLSGVTQASVGAEGSCQPLRTASRRLLDTCELQ